MSEKDEKNFGFEKVSSKEKRTLVDGVFSDVAGKYDLMNDLMSFPFFSIPGPFKSREREGKNDKGKIDRSLLARDKEAKRGASFFKIWQV